MPQRLAAGPRFSRHRSPKNLTVLNGVAFAAMGPMLVSTPRLVAPTCAKQPRRSLALDSLTRPKIEISVDAYEAEPVTAPVTRSDAKRLARGPLHEERPPSGSMELLDGDFVEIEIDPEDFGETKEQRPAPVLPRATEEKPTIVDPAKARYVVTSGATPGELVLRPLRPGEPPPPEAPIAKLSPSCNYDSFRIAKILNRR